METDSQGNLIRSYTTDTDEYGNLVSIELRGASSEVETYYYLYNGTGEIVALTDDSGKIVVSWEYDSWGKPTKELKWVYNADGTLTGKQEQGIGEFGNPYLYKGYYYDVETGLYYLNARYYDPSVGRFLSRDPNGASEKDRLEQNPYLYVKNNPVNSEDPSGLKSAYWWYRHNKYMYEKTGKLRYKARMGRWQKIWQRQKTKDITKAAYWKGANQKKLDRAKTKAAQAIERGNVKDYLKYKDQASLYQKRVNSWSNKLTQAKIQIEIKKRLSAPCASSHGRQPFVDPSNCTNCHDQKPSKGESGIRNVDYLSGGFNIGPIVGFTVQARIDRYGNVYGAGGIEAGKSLTTFSGSLAGQWLLQEACPSKSKMKAFSTGPSVSVDIGYWGGYEGSWSPGKGFSSGGGFVSPQIGISGSYSVEIMHLPFSW